MKKKPKRYEINTFEKLINIVNKENFEGLSTDFLLWLHYTMITIEALKEKDPEGCKGKTNWEIMQSIFIWVDDGNGRKFSVRWCVRTCVSPRLFYLKFERR